MRLSALTGIAHAYREGMVKLVSEVVSGIGSVVGLRGGTEEPRHTVEKLSGGVELRRYSPRIAAQTTVSGPEETARSAGFRRLAGYIFGANVAGEKIAMTAPVAQESGMARDGEKIAMTAPVSQTTAPDGGWVIRFFMPSQWTLATLPEPKDASVELVEVPAETVAALRFSGDRGPDAVASRTADLLRALADTTWSPAGAPVAWFYDPPWTVPFLRRNEVAVPVAAG